VLEVLDIEPPQSIRGVTQAPLHGISFREMFDNAEAPSRRRTQYYEMLGNRAIYHDGWKLVTYHGTQGAEYDGVTDPSKPFDDDRWELYHVEEDFSEFHDLAAEYPRKVRELEALWWAEAGRYQVLPLDARGFLRTIGQPRLTAARRRFVYYPDGAPVESAAAVNVKNRSHSITAQVVIPESGAEGVLLADGGRFGGYSLYVKGGRLCYAYNFLDSERHTIVSDHELPVGDCELRFEFEKTGAERFGAGGVGRLYINGRLAGEYAIPRTIPFVYSIGGCLHCGRDEGNPVTEDYRSPFAFSGTIRHVTVEVSGGAPTDRGQQLRIDMARQ